MGYELLSDPSGRLVDAFGLRHKGGGPGGIDISRSASILLDTRGKVIWYSITPDFRVRPSPEDVLAAIDSVLTQSDP